MFNRAAVTRKASTTLQGDETKHVLVGHDSHVSRRLCTYYNDFIGLHKVWLRSNKRASHGWCFRQIRVIVDSATQESGETLRNPVQAGKLTSCKWRTELCEVPRKRI